jgi:hypothetical protein
MYQYTILNVYKDERGTTCEHCGRGIKNVVEVKDNHTGEIMIIGTTCINKLMSMNEGFAKRVDKEVKKYMKLIEKVNNFNLENEVSKVYDELQTIEERDQCSFNDNHTGFLKIWNDSTNSFRYKTNEEFESTKQELINDLRYWNEVDVKNLNKLKELLNTISKNNLFQL